MADPISIAEAILNIGLSIKQIVDEVKAFKDYAEKLLFRIKHLTPALQPLVDMKNQRDKLLAAQKQDSEMKAFAESLADVLTVVEEVKVFIEDLKDLSNFRKVKEKGKIKKTFETFDGRLDVLKDSITLGILAEMKRDISNDRSKQQDSVKILVKKVKHSSKQSSSAGSGGTGSKGAVDDTPAIEFKALDLVKELGEGGFGSVWLANYRHGEQVAVKIFEKGNNQDNGPLLKEISKMRKAIFSPYIVRLVGVIDELEVQGIVMDFFEYGSLKSFLQYLDCDCWPRRLRMLCDIASGINHLHSLAPPIVHRDVKLLNMFVDHGFTVKIGDLGLSSSGTTVTKARSQVYLMGTYSHMAPEVWAGTAKGVEPSRDIYEVGISIYEFITGQNPWPRAKLDEIRGLVIGGVRPNVAIIKSDTPPEVVTMMQRCWEGDPQCRPTSQEIQRSFSKLYTSRYEKGLKHADRAIRKMIDVAADTSKNDSGISSDIGDRSGAKSAIAPTREDTSRLDIGLGAQSGENYGHVRKVGYAPSGNLGRDRPTRVEGVRSAGHAQTVGHAPAGSWDRGPPTRVDGRSLDLSGQYRGLGAHSVGNYGHAQTVAYAPDGNFGRGLPTRVEGGQGYGHAQTVAYAPAGSWDRGPPTRVDSRGVDLSGQYRGLGAHSVGNYGHAQTVAYAPGVKFGRGLPTRVGGDQGYGHAQTVAYAGSWDRGPPTRLDGRGVDLSGQYRVLGAQSGGSYRHAKKESSGRDLPKIPDESGMKWQFRYTIDTARYVQACHTISQHHLALCMRGCVKVYEVNTGSSHLEYTVRSDEWKDLHISGVAVSPALPDSMLVICRKKPYVFQYACHEPTNEIWRYEIQSDVNNPNCIVANADVAVIAMSSVKSFIVCVLPELLRQHHVQIDFTPVDLSISSDFVLLLGKEVIAVRALYDVYQDVCRVNPPDGWKCTSASFRYSAREMYVACGQGYRGCVYKYTWDGVGEPKYTKSCCIIDGLGKMSLKLLTVTSEGLLAVEQSEKMQIYKLQ